MPSKLLDYLAKKRDANIIRGLRKLLQEEKTVLDVGCGAGRLSSKIQQKLGLRVQGVDVWTPKQPRVPVALFDGRTLPFAKQSFDAVFLLDVLHHTPHASQLLQESLRVAKHSVVIKDHYYESKLDLGVLKLADVAGNLADRVRTPFQFKSKKEWARLLKGRQIASTEWRSTFVPGITFPQIMYRVKK